MKIDFTDSPIAPEESRAARSLFGLSQAQAAEQSGLPAHKIKRFETATYITDRQFLVALRQFYEGLGYVFRDEDSPGAKAKARGDVFAAGVVGETGSSPEETTGSTSEIDGKPRRLHPANVQYMRITPALSNDQIDRILSAVDDNITAIEEGASQKVNRDVFSNIPNDESQAQAVALLRCLAENGLMHARLLGHALMPMTSAIDDLTPANAKTIGDLLDIAMLDMQRAVIDGDKDAAGRRKGRSTPKKVLQALAS